MFHFATTIYTSVAFSASVTSNLRIYTICAKIASNWFDHR